MKVYCEVCKSMKEFEVSFGDIICLKCRLVVLSFDRDVIIEEAK